MSDLALDTFLLCALHAHGDAGLAEERLLRDARAEGFGSTTQPQLVARLRGLADQSWVVPYTPPLGAQRWRITARGTAALQEAKLA